MVVSTTVVSGVVVGGGTKIFHSSLAACTYMVALARYPIGCKCNLSNANHFGFAINWVDQSKMVRFGNSDVALSRAALNVAERLG